MNFNLRNAILANISNNTEQQIEATIKDAIQRGEEKMLPGLGVLFEVYWQGASEQERNQMVQTITNNLSSS